MHVTYLSLPSRVYLSLNNQSRCVDAHCSILLHCDINHDEGPEKRMNPPTDGGENKRAFSEYRAAGCILCARCVQGTPLIFKRSVARSWGGQAV